MTTPSDDSPRTRDWSPVVPQMGTPRRTWMRGGTVLLALVAVAVLVILLLPREGAASPPVPSSPASSDAETNTSLPSAESGLSEEQAAVEAARETYRGFIETLDRLQVAGDAAERPREEVEAEINQYATGAAGANAVETIVFYSQQGITQTGEALIVSLEAEEVHFTPEKTANESTGEVTLRSCLDLSQQRLRFPDGTPIDAPGNPSRVLSRPLVRLRDENEVDGWRIEEIDIEQGEEC